MPTKNQLKKKFLKVQDPDPYLSLVDPDPDPGGFATLGHSKPMCELCAKALKKGDFV
jgi:hypothetical protein